MADRPVDDRDLRIVLDLLNGLLEDHEEDIHGHAERSAYERLCKAAGVVPIEPFEEPQTSLGFLGDEPPRPHGGKGIMSDYIHRTQSFLRGGSGAPWPPEPPKPDRAKEIADRMARSASDAAHGRTPPPAPAPEKRPLTDEEKQALREALGESE